MHHGFGFRQLSQQTRQLRAKWACVSRKCHSASERPALKSQGQGRIIFSGIQPTGVPHIGNYLGALKQWHLLQLTAADDDQLFFCIADLHALTDPTKTPYLRQWRRETLASLLAIGLDPERCNIFFQSSIAEHSELMWILTCFSSVGHLARMTQWKGKLPSTEQFIAGSNNIPGIARMGLLSYPILQAADILLYGSTHVPVGADQAQHLEFTRDLAAKFNATHGSLFVEPQTLLCTFIRVVTVMGERLTGTAPTARVMSLRTPQNKMSKSDPDLRSRILLSDSLDVIRDKVANALTDSHPSITFDPTERAGISNLLTIMSCFDEHGRSPQALAYDYHDLSKRLLKEHATDMISVGLEPIRDRYRSLMARKDLRSDINSGSLRAKEKASAVMNRVRISLGLNDYLDF